VHTVLVTGSAGKIESSVVAALEARGDEVRRFDLVDGGDLRDAAAVARAVEGCDAIVHAAAVPHDRLGSAEEIAATNVTGTEHVLDAAAVAGVARIIAFSSVWVFGFWDGAGEPAYLPIDDDHPRRADRPYGTSKCAVEDLCRAWSDGTGSPTVVLRPVFVADDRDIATRRSRDLYLGAWVHVDDVVAAVLAGLDRDVPRHTRALLSASGPVDTRVAREVLGWEPQRRWPRPPLRRQARSAAARLLRRSPTT
jgi:nucleoside-diphosphate-sugar epimerase